MQATLYKNNSDRRVVSKSLSDGLNVSITIKDNTDIDNPIITLNYNSNYLNYNYLYIPEFSSYYYINDKNVCIGQEIELICEVDLRKTMEADIKASTAHIVRSLTGYKYIPDAMATQTEKTAWKSVKIGGFTKGNHYILVKGGE